MKDNKTIFFFLGNLNVGGTEVVATRIGEGLGNRGYTVKYILLKDQIELPIDKDAGNIISLNTEKFKNKKFKILFALFSLWKEYLKYKPYRIVSFVSGINVLLFFSFLPNQVYTVDTNLFWVKTNLYRRKILKGVGYFPNIKKVIVPSNELRLKFKGYVPSKSFRKFVTIHNPLSKEAVLQHENGISINQAPYFVSVGRLNKYKGFTQLIKCFSRARIPIDFKLYIIGSGPMHTSLENLINELGMTNRIKLLGYRPNPAPLMADAEALILNSTFESFGNVLVEALSLGTPVISNDCDFGPREIIEDGTNGLLYDQEKDENLIKVLEEFANSESLRNKLKENTSYRMNRFGSEKIIQEWIEKILQ